VPTVPSRHATRRRCSRPRMLSREMWCKWRSGRGSGATRFCMGTAWRDAKDGPAFESVLDMVRAVRGVGLEACLTHGHVTTSSATAWPKQG